MKKDFKLPDEPSKPLTGHAWSNPNRVRLHMDCVDNLVKRAVLTKLHPKHIAKISKGWYISPEASKVPMYLYKREYHWLDDEDKTISL